MHRINKKAECNILAVLCRATITTEKVKAARAAQLRELSTLICCLTVQQHLHESQAGGAVGVLERAL